MAHTFYLDITNDIHAAKVTEVLHPHHQLYHVLFEDGYENIFFTDAETGIWLEEDLGETSLAASFGTKIQLLSAGACRLPKPLAWCKASIADKIVSFGFYTYGEGADTFFEIYGANHKFLCTLKNNNNNWEVHGIYSLMAGKRYDEQINIIICIFKGLGGCI